MLSILIPTYNYNCFDFVYTLNQQALTAKLEYEIIVADDCSSSPIQENKNINSLPNCSYIELNQNIGRSKIRNLLADKAQYNCLLFLDCDSEIVYENFIERYLNCCSDKKQVICGGRLYKTKAPENKQLFLHWLYGSKREVISVVKRQRNPNRSFMSNNFIINKALFNQIRFNENIHKYGHEDTLFGIELNKRNIAILHIENPLYHVGLEKNEVIIEKEKQSIENLYTLCTSFYSLAELAPEIKLLRYVQKIKKLHLSKLMNWVYACFHTLIEKNLKSNYPQLLLFDLYKLSYFFYLKNKS